MLYQQIKKEYDRLQQKILSLEKELSTCPEGKLICCHQKKYSKWYVSDGLKKTYIPKANRQFAEKLALKKFLTAQLQELKLAQRTLKFYLDHHCEETSFTNKLWEDSAFRDLLSPIFTPTSETLSKWQTEPFEANPKHPEHLSHKTTAGFFVRSKSEAMITHILHVNRIPFRYESPLTINNTTIYPDFTLRHPATGRLYYWEHFGKMDDLVYCKNAAAKLQLYITHGFIPSVHLITTYESSENPLDMDTIQKLVEHYFL